MLLPKRKANLKRLRENLLRYEQEQKVKKMDTVSVGEMLKTHHNNCGTKYTSEETTLHQRMFNTLASQVVQQEVKQLRLQRKLNKIKNIKS